MSAENLWITLPICNDEPAKVALLSRFLLLHEFEFHETTQGLLIDPDEAERLIVLIHPWAFDTELLEDDRDEVTLASTLKEIGEAVLVACGAAEQAGSPEGAIPISLDLR